MLKEFVEFVDSVLPSVSPDFRDGAKNAILQFEKEGNEPNYLMYDILEELSQGDIISKVPFTFFSDNGEILHFVSDAMVISTSCHIDQKDKMILAPIFPLSEFKGNVVALKKNTIFDFMYIPDAKMCEKFVSFGTFCTYSKKLIMDGIATNKIKRIASLSQIGYYFFVIKLSVYLMRKEDNGTLKARNNDTAYV